VRFRQMDEFGEYRQIINICSPPVDDLGSPAVSREMARIGNDAMAELVARHPDRFAGFMACLPMDDPAAAGAEVEYACRHRGVLARHPTLKFLIHHGGSKVPHFSGRVGPGWDQLGERTPDDQRELVEGPALSRRPLDYFRMFYADTAMFGASHALRCTIDFYGAHRVRFA